MYEIIENYENSIGHSRQKLPYNKQLINVLLNLLMTGFDH